MEMVGRSNRSDLLAHLLAQHGGEIVEVELSRERHESLQLAVGQSVWFRPRQMRVFGADNQPAAAPEKQAFLF